MVDQSPQYGGRAAGWQATHRVPPGMRVWGEPNPELAPLAAFQETAEVRVEEERGAWARIARADGWGGWVDGRLLESLTVAPPATSDVPPPPPPDDGGSGTFGAVAPGRAAVKVRGLIAAGAGLALLSSVLPWGKAGGTNAFEFELSILWNPDTFGNGGITTGIALLLLALAGLAVATLRRLPAWLALPIGVLVLLMGALFFYQMVRDVGSAARAFSDVIGFAPWLTMIGGLGMVLGGLRKT